MQRLMRSELPIFCIKFRDYVRAKYRQELVLTEEFEEHGLPVTSKTIIYLLPNRCMNVTSRQVGRAVIPHHTAQVIR